MVSILGCASSPPPYSYSGKKGTQKPYRIDGKWYTPVESSYGFEETGLASWYGRDFHGKKTSNGERYDMYAMTAAHKTLPMNTYVKVTRLDDGRETIVRINDRGPFVKGRVIDLSFTAAKDIGIDKDGTARVRLTALGSRNGQNLIQSNYDSGNFLIQVGAFTVRDNALRLKDQLAMKYRGASVSEFEKDSKTFFRVRIGPINSLSETKRLLKNVSSEGFDSSFIVRD